MSQSPPHLTIKIPKSNYLEDCDENLMFTHVTENPRDVMGARCVALGYTISLIALSCFGINAVCSEDLYEGVDVKRAMAVRSMYGLTSSLLIFTAICGMINMNGRNHVELEKKVKIILLGSACLMLGPLPFFLEV
jgi:hypothetical protein